MELCHSFTASFKQDVMLHNATEIRQFKFPYKSIVWFSVFKQRASTSLHSILLIFSSGCVAASSLPLHCDSTTRWHPEKFFQRSRMHSTILDSNCTSFPYYLFILCIALYLLLVYWLLSCFEFYFSLYQWNYFYVHSLYNCIF